jgi:hypothetical protein
MAAAGIEAAFTPGIMSVPAAIAANTSEQPQVTPDATVKAAAVLAQVSFVACDFSVGTSVGIVVSVGVVALVSSDVNVIVRCHESLVSCHVVPPASGDVNGGMQSDEVRKLC